MQYLLPQCKELRTTKIAMKWLRVTPGNNTDYYVFLDIPRPQFAQILQRGFKEGEVLRVCHTLPPHGRDPHKRKKLKDDKGWMAEIILSPHPNISGYCLCVRRSLRDIDDMQPRPGQPSAGQANTSTNNPPSVPRPRALRRPAITQINASNRVTDPMPEQGAYLLVKESLKTVKTRMNSVAKLLPGNVKKKKGLAVSFGAVKDERLF